MDFQHINVCEVLKINNVELYKTHKDLSTLLTKGTLYVLYSQEYNWFILKINDFNYGLAKNLPVLASSQEKGAARAYVLVNMDGYYVIKVLTPPPLEDLYKLENILQNETKFAFKEDPHGDGFPIKLEKGIVRVKEITPQERTMEETKTSDTAQYIYKGGKMARKIMISSAEVISKGMNKLGGYVQTNYLTKREEKKINPKTLSRMSLVNSATGMVNSMSTAYIKGLMSLGQTIAQKLERKLEKKKMESESNNIQDQQKETGGIGHAVAYSAITVWLGMAEALDIIREGFTETTTNLVSHQYGPAAGELFQTGIGIIGNVGLPGKKFFKTRR
jgi:hypothetical protein